VEFLFPYAYPAHDLATRLQANGLQQVLFNAPPGNWDAGERGLACLPGREAEFRDSIAQALAYACALQCPRIHVMAGVVPQGADTSTVRATYIANLRLAAEQAAPHGIHILLEPINHRDMPGFFLNRQDQAHALIAEIGAPNVKVQMDLYHCQIVEGDLAMKIRQYMPTGQVGHFQIAGVPERHEPDVGEVHYPYLFTLLDSLGYGGWIGCEYRPGGGRRHPARAANVLRHAEAHLRAPGRRLHAQGLHRRPRRATDDRHRAPGQAQRRGLVVLQRHHPRAAGRRGGALPGGRRCRTRWRQPAAHGRRADAPCTRPAATSCAAAPR
jgi:hydroxypyruvate isomerase